MADAYGLVGFQNHLRYGEQARVLRLIPGLENAEFLQFGQIHRNTFINSPKILNEDLSTRANPRLFFAGQITGVEGYVESAAIGLLAGRFAAAERRGETIVPPPPQTAHGALLGHITGGQINGHVETIDAGPRSFQPMNVNFGLFPPLVHAPQVGADGKKLRGTAKTIEKRRQLCRRALAELERWDGGAVTLAAE